MRLAALCTAAAEAPSTVQYKFAVRRPTVGGEDVFLSGSCDALGRWDLSSCVAMTWTQGHWWQAQAMLPLGCPVEFKYLVKAQSLVTWEPGCNQKVQVSGSPQCLTDLASGLSELNQEERLTRMIKLGEALTMSSSCLHAAPKISCEEEQDRSVQRCALPHKDRLNLLRVIRAYKAAAECIVKQAHEWHEDKERSGLAEKLQAVLLVVEESSFGTQSPEPAEPLDRLAAVEDENARLWERVRVLEAKEQKHQRELAFSAEECTSLRKRVCQLEAVERRLRKRLAVATAEPDEGRSLSQAEGLSAAGADQVSRLEGLVKSLQSCWCEPEWEQHEVSSGVRDDVPGRAMSNKRRAELEECASAEDLESGGAGELRVSHSDAPMSDPERHDQNGAQSSMLEHEHQTAAVLLPPPGLPTIEPVSVNDSPS